MTDEIISFELDGKNPSFVDMPVWYTHNISNIGEDELLTYFGLMNPIMKMIQILIWKMFNLEK